MDTWNPFQIRVKLVLVCTMDRPLFPLRKFCKDNLGKDNLGKDNLGKDIIGLLVGLHQMRC